ncbi:MAG: hypothetical protein M0Z82_08710 [Actinomycetota bacterium]|jgi:2-methylcitrate dehydratase PrpD|nr:hypothetical protein [Actinomycetota bacterium]
MALDFDDYFRFGHSGHSAVLVPPLLAAETRSCGPDQLTVQIVANERDAERLFDLLGGATAS